MGETPTGPPEASAGNKTLAEKLDYLFKTVKVTGPDGVRREYKYQEVEQALRERDYDISGSYLQYLRTGKRDNPTKKHLEALAAFFGVPAAYFLDDDDRLGVEQDLELLTALQDAGVRSIALRAADLTPVSRELLSQILDTMRTIGGVDLEHEKK